MDTGNYMANQMDDLITAGIIRMERISELKSQIEWMEEDLRQLKEELRELEE
jgi:phosphoglycerate-specific signal transduction histidine kinase